MARKFKLLLLAVLMLLAFSQAALAALSAVGPINPANGFPQYYRDAAGVTLDLPTPPLGDGVTAPTMIFGPLTPTSNAFAVQIGFELEAFYFNCRVQFKPPVTATNTGRVLYLAGLEASFANGVVTQNGDQTVFSRIRLFATGVQVPGTYKVQHPYGTENVTVTAADIAAGKGLKFTRDIPVGTPLNFTAALAGDVGPFLRQVLPAPPAGWIGDGVNLCTISGSPIGFNKLVITAPAGLDWGTGTGNVLTLTDQFTVSGHKFTGAVATPLTVDRATFTRSATAGTQVEAFATSLTTATANLTIDPAAPPVAMTRGAGPFAGKFFVRAPSAFPFPQVDATTGQPFITVSAAVGLGAPTVINQPLVDLVTITSATFNTATKILTITAVSGDQVGLPALSVTNPPLGVMTNGTLKKASSIPPPTVTVSSAGGGSDTAPVVILP